MSVPIEVGRGPVHIGIAGEVVEAGGLAADEEEPLAERRVRRGVDGGQVVADPVHQFDLDPEGDTSGDQGRE